MRARPLLALSFVLTASCQTTDRSTKVKSNEPSDTAGTHLNCSSVDYNVGFNVKISGADGSKAIKATIERVKGPDGDGEEFGPATYDGEKVHGDCDTYDFGKGYVKTCDGKTAELTMRELNETAELDCK